GGPDGDPPRGAAGHPDRDSRGAGAGGGRDGAAPVHRLQQPLLVDPPRPADRVSHGAGVHLRDFTVRGLAPAGVGGRDRPHRRHPGLLAPGARRDPAPGEDASRMIKDAVMPGVRIAAPARAKTAPPPAVGAAPMVEIDRLSLSYGAA